MKIFIGYQKVRHPARSSTLFVQAISPKPPLSHLTVSRALVLSFAAAHSQAARDRWGSLLVRAFKSAQPKQQRRTPSPLFSPFCHLFLHAIDGWERGRPTTTSPRLLLVAHVREFTPLWRLGLSCIEWSSMHLIITAAACHDNDFCTLSTQPDGAAATGLFFASWTESHHHGLFSKGFSISLVLEVKMMIRGNAVAGKCGSSAHLRCQLWYDIVSDFSKGCKLYFLR